jgi:CcmD family protein
VTTAEKYVTAAYLVVFAVVLAYVLIMATKLARLEREVAELEELARSRRAEVDEARKAAAERPVRDSGPVEGVWGNREVPPAAKPPVRDSGPVEGVWGNREVPPAVAGDSLSDG